MGLQIRPECQIDARGGGREEVDKSRVEEMISNKGQWPAVATQRSSGIRNRAPGFLS